MALFILGTAAAGVTGVTVSGITDVTECSVEEAVGNISRAKDGKGDVKAALISKPKRTMTASGYSTGAGAPALRGPAICPGFSGSIIESSMEATSEDLSKFSITAVQIV